MSIVALHTGTPTTKSGPPSQLSIEALHTATLHIYIYIYECMPLHCIHIYIYMHIYVTGMEKGLKKRWRSLEAL